jgi:hypothetical protein
MRAVDALEAVLMYLHEKQGKLGYFGMEGYALVGRYGYVPERMGRVAALIGNYAVNAGEERHQSQVHFCHILEVSIVKVQLVVYLLLAHHPVHHLHPRFKLFFLLCQYLLLGHFQATSDEAVYTGELIAQVPHLVFTSQILTQDGFGEL